VTRLLLYWRVPKTQRLAIWRSKYGHVAFFVVSEGLLKAALVWLYYSEIATVLSSSTLAWTVAHCDSVSCYAVY
jgi:hypothetical protein